MPFGVKITGNPVVDTVLNWTGGLVVVVGAYKGGQAAYQWATGPSKTSHPKKKKKTTTTSDRKTKAA